MQDLSKIHIRPLASEDVSLCKDLLHQLPDWFGIEDAIVEYIETLSSLDGFVAESAGAIIGFVGLKRYGEYSIEIDVIGVMPKLHRQGVGRKLLEHVRLHATTPSTKLLHMKTIAPTSPDPNYAKTRKFWEGNGFIPMDALDIWDEHNPCQIMVKPL